MAYPLCNSLALKSIILILDEQWKGYQKSESYSKGSPKKLVKQPNVIEPDSTFEAGKSEDGVRREDGSKSVGFA